MCFRVAEAARRACSPKGDDQGQAEKVRTQFISLNSTLPDVFTFAGGSMMNAA